MKVKQERNIKDEKLIKNTNMYVNDTKYPLE